MRRIKSALFHDLPNGADPEVMLHQGIHCFVIEWFRETSMNISQRPSILYWSSVGVDHLLFANSWTRFPCRNPFVILRRLLLMLDTFWAGKLMILIFEARYGTASRALRYVMLGSINQGRWRWRHWSFLMKMGHTTGQKPPNPLTC